MHLIYRAGQSTGPVFIACLDTNFWIKRNGIHKQFEAVMEDPMFLVNAIEL